MDNIQKNKIKSIISITLRTCALLCATGSLMQTFLVSLGFNAELIYIHSTLVQAANIITIMLCTRFADSGNIIRKAAIVQIPAAVCFLLFLPFCILRSASAVTYIFLVLISVFQSISTGLYTVCEYKLPYYIYRNYEYGMISSVCGVLSALISFGVGALMSHLSGFIPYTSLMFYAFAIACVFLTVALILCGKQKAINFVEKRTDDRKKVRMSVMIRHPAFSKLFIAHLFRGFCYGIVVNVLTVSAVELGFDETITMAMVSVQSIATLSGCITFGFLSKHITARIPVFIGSISMVLLPLIFFADKYVFLAIYAVVSFGRSWVDYGIMVLMLYAVPVDIAGQYNALRMILHFGGGLIATGVAVIISGEILMVVTAVLSTVSGFMFLLTQILRRSSPLRVIK